MWHFSKGDLDGRACTDPTAKTVQSHSELSQLDIFVREILQNALDNREGESAVKVTFRLLYLSGEAKSKFLQTMKFEQLGSHISSVWNEASNSNRYTNLSAPDSVFDAGYDFKILYIEDFGTKGLIGPEYDREPNQPDAMDVPSCFIGLCRNIGDSQKGIHMLGGFHGFGKTVLWKNSRVKTIMFYSRLATPYIEYTNDHNTIEHRCRFFGQVRLTGHYIDDQPYASEGYYGNRVEEMKLTRAIYDGEADEEANALGIAGRSEDMCGTSIVVADFDDPDIPDDEEDEANTAERIKYAAEKYFWPAIIDNRLIVHISTGEEAASNPLLVAQPELRSDLMPFIKAYQDAMLDEAEQNTRLKKCEIDLPQGPRDEPRGKALLMIATRLAEADQDYTDMSLHNRVALIRGSGMVVGYWRVPRQGLGGKDFYSIALGGRAYNVTNTGYDQERLEKLLAWAEPVTHDNWTDNSDMLSQWKKAKARIKSIKNDIKKAISEETVEKARPQGKAAPFLSAMFPFDKGDAKKSDIREISIEIVRKPFDLKKPREDNLLEYGFEIKIHVPGRKQFQKARKPGSWRVKCKYGFHGEGKRRRIIDHAKSSFTRVRVNEDDWETLPQDFQNTAIFERTVDAKEVTYSLRGRSEPLDPTMALSTKHDIEITVERGYEEESL